MLGRLWRSVSAFYTAKGHHNHTFFSGLPLQPVCQAQTYLYNRDFTFLESAVKTAMRKSVGLLSIHEGPPLAMVAKVSLRADYAS